MREASIIHENNTMFWYVKYTGFANLIAFLLGFYLYKRFPREIKILYYFVALGAVTEIYNKIHINYILKNSMPIGHFYYPLAIILLGIFYIQILKGFLKPAWIIVTISAYVTYCIINVVFIQGLFEYPSVTASLGSLILFLFSVAYFVKVMSEAKIEKLSTNPHIWVNTGILFYYSLGFFYHSLYNLRFKASIEIVYFAANTFSLVNQIFYIIIITGFFLATKKDQNIQY
jgi:hypothetical protein